MIEEQEDEECITIKAAKPKSSNLIADPFNKSEISQLENDEELKSSKKCINKEEFNDLSLSTSQKSAATFGIFVERSSEIICQVKNSFGKKKSRKSEGDSCCSCLIT
ncbi:hypothetical protein SteCoe_10499 [Stentor coeruleus]|uniref:Uncharacterized protein n=1 Tax=Stentor coeruleus TaxID=5963 RepID=A0A1R2CFF2_9CILI|nr:hypothetical protein SteCoe_10499 [Stentor coeruleus]